MSYAMNYSEAAAYAAQSERATFIRRTYMHLAGAVLAFSLIDIAIFKLVGFERLTEVMRAYLSSPISHLVLLLAFVGAGWLARAWAYNGSSQAMQYLGLGLY